MNTGLSNYVANQSASFRSSLIWKSREQQEFVRYIFSCVYLHHLLSYMNSYVIGCICNIIFTYLATFIWKLLLKYVNGYIIGCIVMLYFIMDVEYRILYCYLQARKGIFFYRTGLISPGVSVPIQVPGGGHFQDHPSLSMGAMTSQYWPRLQWRCDLRDWIYWMYNTAIIYTNGLQSGL